jgi:hypothetical protein
MSPTIQIQPTHTRAQGGWRHGLRHGIGVLRYNKAFVKVSKQASKQASKQQRGRKRAKYETHKSMGDYVHYACIYNNINHPTPKQQATHNKQT